MPRTKQRPLSEEKRAERRRADREFANEAVAQLRDSECWRAWLEIRRHFRCYSMINQVLIARQCPGATRVAGFRAWLKLGYAVRRGERAIRIWVPMAPSRMALEKWEREGGDADERPRTRFRLGPVFERSQVAPLPPPAVPVALDPPVQAVEGDELAPVLPRLIALAGEIGCTVEFEEMKYLMEGLYQHAKRRIAICVDMSVNEQVATLIHELGHALLRIEPDEGDPELDLACEELAVESVAFTVCGALGVDTAGYSIPYLASWSQSVGLAVIERTAALIDRVARRIEDAALAAQRNG